jgi:hypothetical protein
MIFWIVLAAVILIGYMWLVKNSIQKKFAWHENPDCVTCNGWPVCMVYYTWGYYGDWFPRETLCLLHQIQGEHIARLESQILDKPLPV